MKSRTIRNCVLVLAVYIASVQSAQAQWAVTDAGSYVYYAEQIKQMTDQIQQIREQTIGQFKRLEDIKSQVSGQFNGLMGIYKKLNGIKSAFDVKPTSLLAEAQKWTKLKDLVGGYTGIEGAISDTFKDPRGLDPNVNKIAYMNRQYSMRQNALKSAISHADTLLQTVPERMEAINALQEAASQATSQGDKQDMTNAILIELLRTMTTFSSILVEYNQAAALMNFTGVDEGVTKKREAAIWKVKTKTEAATADELKAFIKKAQGLGASANAQYTF